MATMYPDEYRNPRRTAKRREAEAEGDSPTDAETPKDVASESDGDGGEVAPKKKPAVKFTTGTEKLTPEEQARRIKQFRDLQARQRKAVVL